MAVYYFDTSALVKRYVQEEGTNWVKRMTESDANSEVYIVRVTAPEIVAALFRKVRLGEMDRQEALDATEFFKIDLVEQYQVMGVTRELTDIDMSLIQRHPLRGYDSIQLAAALELRTSRISIGAAPSHSFQQMPS